MRRLLGLFGLIAVSAWGQVSWRKVWTSPASGSVGSYFNGYHDIHYDAFTDRTWICSTDTTGGPDSIPAANGTTMPSEATGRKQDSSTQERIRDVDCQSVYCDFAQNGNTGGVALLKSAGWPGVFGPREWNTTFIY
jgi:hypothetical protein